MENPIDQDYLEIDPGTAGMNDPDDTNGKRAGKTRRNRTVYSKKQLELLNRAFQKNRYPGIKEREELSVLIGVMESRIHVWFQNKRARKNKQRKSEEENAENEDTLRLHRPQDTRTVRPEKKCNKVAHPSMYNSYVGHPVHPYAPNIYIYNAKSSQGPLTSRNNTYQDIQATPAGQLNGYTKYVQQYNYPIQHVPYSYLPVNVNNQGGSESAYVSSYANPGEITQQRDEHYSLEEILDDVQSILIDDTEKCTGNIDHVPYFDV
ncbi:retina and anterior neural fold homeobox 2 [Pelobates cultripes]|uniref:Retina and anterior neural fold homeobox 2 n=1 Tax=Pelobates cultripes TaxID=61616 RepID=A0AAD1TBK7_PELCU|nr:retina and anterior neural fold homeobox 2 [Pelobates cultripes]